MIARLVVVALLLAPTPAVACATCVASAYGDRTFNWAFLGLLLMPFAVALGISGVLVARYYAPHWRFRAPHWRARSSGSALAGAAQLAPHEENSL